LEKKLERDSTRVRKRNKLIFDHKISKLEIIFQEENNIKIFKYYFFNFNLSFSNKNPKNINRGEKNPRKKEGTNKKKTR